MPAAAAASRSTKLVKVQPGALAKLTEGGQVAHRRVHPDVEVLARRIGNLETEVGRIARDVPASQAVVKPFLELVDHFTLQATGGTALVKPGSQHVLEIGQAHEDVLRFAAHGGRARNYRVGFDQVGGCIGLAAHLAGVAVLVFGVTVRALALDEAIGQEHLPLGIVELFDRSGLGVAPGAQCFVDASGQVTVGITMGAGIVVIGDAKIPQVGLMLRVAVLDELFRRDALALCPQHDRGAVRIIGANKVHRMPGHAHGAHPDVALTVFDHVPEMNRTVGIGQGTGNQNVAR